MPDTVATPKESAETAAERRDSLDQALASTRLEGHTPTPEFLADCEDYIAGRITREEILAREVGRVLGTKRAADAGRASGSLHLSRLDRPSKQVRHT